MAPKKVKSRCHVFFGELTAAPLLDWLNSPKRPKRDEIERIIRMSWEPETLRDVPGYVAQVAAKWKLAVCPSLAKILSPGHWRSEWKLTRRMKNPLQTLALVKLLHVADAGLLDHVRQCRACPRWFYRRFAQQVCCSRKCQQQALRSTPQWRAKRAAYMRWARHEAKQREKRHLELSKRKDKRR